MVALTLFTVVLLSGIPAVALCIGGLIIQLFRVEPGPRTTSAAQHLAAGVVVAALSTEMVSVLEKENTAQGSIAVTIGYLCGMTLMLFLGRIVCEWLEREEEAATIAHLRSEADSSVALQHTTAIIQEQPNQSRHMPHDAHSFNIRRGVHRAASRHRIHTIAHNKSFLNIPRRSETEPMCSSCQRSSRASENVRPSERGSYSQKVTRDSNLEEEQSESRPSSLFYIMASPEDSGMPAGLAPADHSLLNQGQGASVQDLEEMTASKSAHRGHHHSKHGNSTQSGSEQLPWGILAASCVDGMIDGMLLGIAGAAGAKLGIVLSVAATIEMMFLGMSLSSILRQRNIPRSSAVLVCFMIPLTVLVGGLIGGTIVMHSSGPVVTGSLAFGVASLLYLVAEELLVEAHAEPEADTWYVSALFFIGFLIVLLLGRIELKNY